MGTPPSNLVGPFDVSEHISPPRQRDQERARVSAETDDAAQYSLLPAPDRKEQVQDDVSLEAGATEDHKLTTKLEMSIRLPQGGREAWCSPRGADGAADLGLPFVTEPKTVPNSRSLEPDAWISTPLLRRPGDPLSNRIKFLSASVVAAVFGGYFIFGSADRSADVAVTPEPAAGIPSVAFSSAQEAEVRSAKAMDRTVESRAVPEGPMASLMGRLDINPTEKGIDAKQPPTLPEREKQLLAESSHDSTCFPSASAVLLNHPGARPSWTFRAPGREGTRCWYAETRIKAETGAPSAKAGGITVESQAAPEGETALPQPAGRLDMKPTDVKIDGKQPQTLPESEKQLLSGHDSTCYASASDVRQNHPGAWPSWTLRAPGHEGAKCWYAGTRTTANERRNEMAPTKETIGIESSRALFGVQ
jgi:hypothetical protein